MLGRKKIFAILFSWLLMSNGFLPVMSTDGPETNKPSKLDLPVADDEGLGESPVPSPLPDLVYPPGANFNGLSTWTFNISNYEFDDDTPDDFYTGYYVLDSWSAIRKWASDLFEFSSNFATEKPTPRKFQPKECTADSPCTVKFIRNSKKSVRRTPTVQKGLGVNNCGKAGDWEFSTFEFKHIIRTTSELWDPAKFPMHSWSAAHWRRSDSPYMQATFFFIPKLEVIDYELDEEGKSPVCRAREFYDSWTCVKTGIEEDIYSGCYHSGLCRPSYEKVDGHMVPLECKPGSADPAKDYVPEPSMFVTLQDMFVDGAGLKVPATQWQRDVAGWQGRKATRTGAGLQFREPKPTIYQTKREELLEGFHDWRIRHPDVKVPTKVLRLFFRQPYYLFMKSMRKPSAPKEGYIPFNDLDIKRNKYYSSEPDFSTFVVPFTWSGSANARPTKIDDDTMEWRLDEIYMPQSADPEEKSPPAEEVDGQKLLTKKDEIWNDLSSKLNTLIGEKPK